MVLDSFCVEDGWLRSEDESKSARVLFCAKKQHDGWFTNDNVISQFRKASLIAKAHWPNEMIIIITDNASTHLK